MIIEDPDTFKIWLTARLEPLCDADPAALAKYVYALVKKDKPIDDLKASMIEQLEVFLQKETHGFVDLLFRTLETQEYSINTEVQVVPPSAPPQPPKEPVTDIDLREPPPPSAIEEVERKITVKETEKDERSRRGRKRGSTGSPERRRSRSRSYDRRRSRSRERDRARAWRNKSPPPRRYERRRTYSKSPVRRHSRSRTPTTKRGRYRNRSPPRSLSRTRSRTRSRTPIDNRERKDIGLTSPQRESGHGDTDLRLNPPSQNIQSVVALPPDIHNYPPRRCRDFDEEGFCMRGDLCPYDHGSDPVILEDVGSIYNGSTIQPPIAGQQHQPHHVDPIHHNVPIRPPPPITTNLSEYNPDAPSMEPRMWGRSPFRGGPMMRNMGRGGMMGRGAFPAHQRELINVVTGGPQFRNPRPNLAIPPENTDSRMDGQKRGVFDYNRLGSNRMARPNMLPSGNTSLQLKKVPVGVNNITHLNNHFSKFGKILNIQVGFEGDAESALITFSTHTEANVAYKSTEAVLNNRFIRVYWYNPNNNNNNNSNNNNSSSNNSSNNINHESKQENMPPSNRPSVLERLGAPPSKVLNNLQPSAVVHQEEKVTLANNNLSKTLYIPSAMKKELPVERKAQVAPEVLKKKEEEENLLKEKRKKQEEARKESIKKNADLRKRKQELLEKQLNQQKLLIEKLECGAHTQEQKTKIMSTIKTLQESIENLRKDLATAVEATLTKSKSVLTKEHLDLVKKTREEAQRELLDAELDLYNREQEGKDTMDLKKKVADLKIKAFSLGLSSGAGGRGVTPRGRGSFRGRGRGRGSRFSYSGSYDHNVVDHRPTKLLVSGYEQDDKADVLAHFAQYGEIVDYLSDDATPSLVMNFKSRKEAEVALSKGRNFQDRLLSVTWATPNHNIRSGVPTKNSLTSLMVVDENPEEVLEEAEDEEVSPEDKSEMVSLLSPSALLQDDEEDEDEERSWRR